MIPLTPALEKYIEEHSSAEGTTLRHLNRFTHQHTVNPQMMSGHLQGLFLEFISRIISPKRILEIGTFTGYGTINLAKGLAPDGELITIEKNDELIQNTRSLFEKAGLSSSVTLINGDALKIIPELDTTFDLVFLDGEKSEYPDYYSLIINKLKEGGIILADNTLWGGKVTDPGTNSDASTSGIIKFNSMVRKDQRVTVIILPMRDGLSVIRKH
jgi:caffeoyl-CoA O-methyltransferase